MTKSLIGTRNPNTGETRFATEKEIAQINDMSNELIAAIRADVPGFIVMAAVEGLIASMFQALGEDDAGELLFIEFFEEMMGELRQLRAERARLNDAK